LVPKDYSQKSGQNRFQENKQRAGK